MLEYIVLSGRNKIYAIIESGGKQYKVAPGKTVDVERLNVAEGEAVELDRVLLIAEEDKVTFGNPVIEGAKVTATSKGEFKDDKVIVFKYKPKVRYRKKTGPPAHIHHPGDRQHQPGRRRQRKAEESPPQHQERGNRRWRIKREAAPPDWAGTASPNGWASNAMPGRK